MKTTTFISRQVVLTGMASLMSVTALAQQITVKGVVKDATGEPVIGANVVVKGTATGTVTDFDGNFTLSVPKGSTLVISFIGYVPQEVVAAPNMNIVLKDDAQLLQDVVVIGYGVARKSDMTGSVTAIKPDQMNRGLVTNAQDMMAGKMAGVSVISDGGTPGGGATIRIRGGSSLNASNDPLIVIDGLAMDNTGVQGLSNPLSMVNPADIESFTVLKDASATAIYGSRASNGVIIITTKKGSKNSKPRVSYNGNISTSFLADKVDVMNADQFRELIANKYGTTSNEYKQLGTSNTNWQNQIYRAAVSTDHNVTITGGYKNVPYRATIGYTTQNGVLKTSNFQRYTASLSLTPTFFDDHLRVNFNLKTMIATNRFADGGAVGAALRMDPTQSVLTTDADYQTSFGGYWQWTGANGYKDAAWPLAPNSQAPGNPVALLKMKDDHSNAKSLVGNLELSYKFHFLPELRWNMNGGWDRSIGKQNTDILPTSSTNNYYGNYGFTHKYKYNLSYNTYLQYMKEFTKWRFDVMAGYEWQHFYNDGYSYYAGVYPSTAGANAGSVYQPSTNAWANENFLVSFFGRANVTLLDRYLFTATVRRDGSSRFHKDNRWGTFPSFALAWNAKEEGFLKDVESVTDAKLRLGYGITGQQGLDNAYYEYLAKYYTNIAGAYYPVIGDGTTDTPSTFTRNLKWEKTTTYNVGVDLGFFQNRLTVTADAYVRKTKDLLNNVYIAAGTNFGTMAYRNIGSLENKGVEVAVGVKPIQREDLQWNVDVNFTYNKNKITKLLDGDAPDYRVPTGGISSGTGITVQAQAVGHPINSFYVYQQVYGTDGKPIQDAYVDRNGDGKITDADRYFYKKPAADVLMGLSSKLIYKAWDLSMTFRASFNNYVYNDVEASNSDLTQLYINSYLGNRTLSAFDTNFGYAPSNTTYLSDYFVQNASFLKLDNISLGYSFSRLFGGNTSGRVFGTVQNVFTITKYKGLDPEISSGIDNNIYPRPMTVLVGLSLNF